MRTESFWKWFDEHARPRLGVRAKTFVKMFEYLDRFDRHVNIVETGCCRRDPAEDESWRGDGCSTIMFDRYVSERADGSKVFSVDLSEEAVDVARRNVSEFTTITAIDSVKFLENVALLELANPGNAVMHLLYLDSFDYNPANPIPSAVHHHAELLAAMPVIRLDTLVVVDDSPTTIDETPRAEIGGKGFLVARHMTLCGADMEFCDYQAGWTNVRPVRSKVELDLEDLVGRARAAVEAGKILRAEQIYRLILGITTPPQTGKARIAHGEACGFYGRLAAGRQKLGVAADWYREAISADPLSADHRLDMVTNCHLPMGNVKAALGEAERATKVEPDYPRAWHVLSGVHHEMMDATKCVEACERELDLAPDDSDALLDRAVIALDLADYATAESMCCAVIRNDHERAPDAWHCLAMIAYRRHEHEDAISLFDKAIAMGCRDPGTAHWNKSLALHSIGHYREGWVEHEWREHNRANPALYLPMKRFTLPRWTGAEPAIDAAGRPKVIHVHAEAGAGDNLALLRYLPLLGDLGFRVRYEALDGMTDLVRQSFPDVEVVPRAIDYPGALGIRPFDYHIPVGSLPAVFGTEVDTVPWRGPYLRADNNAAAKFGARLRPGPKVGVCWSSGIRKTGIWIEEYGKRKSMRFESIIPIVDAVQRIDSATVVNLQIGPERKQHGGWVEDLLSERPSWAETAALIENLDLVITVDTGLAHLAGAMGKETWLMCQRDGASWHFMCWRPGAFWNDASPWYPGMRVFRQAAFEQPHQWDGVVQEVVAALDDHFARRREAV